MKYEFNGKKLQIPDNEIAIAMKNLEITKEEAIEMWLEDEGYIDNPEQIELTKKAKDNKITATIHQASAETAKKEKKPRTVVASDEKQLLFNDLLDFLTRFAAAEDGELTVLKENKLFSLKLGEKTFKIDLIEQRSPKKEKK